MPTAVHSLVGDLVEKLLAVSCDDGWINNDYSQLMRRTFVRRMYHYACRLYSYWKILW